MIELGGTIGDIESMPFVEALRQLQLKVGQANFCLVHVSMVPTVGDLGEQKTKPTQHSVKELRSLGLTPDFIVCRSKDEVQVETREKIGSFCNVPTERVLSLYDVPNIYRVPLEMLDRNMDILISEQLGLSSYRQSEPTSGSSATATRSKSAPGASDAAGSLVRLTKDADFAKRWTEMTETMARTDLGVVKIALVGKYLAQADSYLSIQSALHHACVASAKKLKINYVDSASLEAGDAASWTLLKDSHGVLVPGGFGDRGTDGKVLAIRHARESRVPFLGICLGMQLAVVEFARHVLKHPRATSSEFDKAVEGTDDEFVLFMPEGSKDAMGGTMRLGSRPTNLKPDTLASRIYADEPVVHERHRHRYEVNPKRVPALEAGGLLFSGVDDSGDRAEVIELCPETFDHPFFFGLQGHPEYKSRPLSPSPPFLAFVRAAADAA